MEHVEFCGLLDQICAVGSFSTPVTFAVNRSNGGVLGQMSYKQTLLTVNHFKGGVLGRFKF